MKLAPARFLVIVRDHNEKTVAQYDLTLPLQGEPGHVTQSSSFHQFRDMETARSQGSPLRRTSFTEWDWATNIKLVRIDCRSVRNIWDLYRKIGYDHKAQTYK